MEMPTGGFLYYYGGFRGIVFPEIQLRAYGDAFHTANTGFVVSFYTFYHGEVALLPI
jgi:hypothetical protein